jgi:hypothetical protein
MKRSRIYPSREVKCQVCTYRHRRFFGKGLLAELSRMRIEGDVGNSLAGGYAGDAGPEVDSEGGVKKRTAILIRDFVRLQDFARTCVLASTSPVSALIRSHQLLTRFQSVRRNSSQRFVLNIRQEGGSRCWASETSLQGSTLLAFRQLRCWLVLLQPFLRTPIFAPRSIM